ncbi:MAG: hypothetical protein Unbinned1473contig1002_12 [Prokaryotic dsDNA virus sp.]|nr:MAG: hypothetical protein Unbinned1473contig1002_12 [Prokaryotic dsDNA virus sp.]|tara:strand:+ start:6951 stop:8660 length:1710 start_codon:yes stop_codon:yes gene_type:complete
MAIKFLSDLDVSGKLNLNDNFLENIKLQHLATNPDPVEGKIYYNTTNDVIMVCQGTSASDWTALSSATGDITEVIGGTSIDVSGGTTGAATVNLDSSTVSAISANTAKTGITASQASAITANTAKTGITDSQASAITANSAKNTNVSTNLSVTQDGTQLVVTSSDGTNASLPLADTDNWGVISDEIFDQIQANVAKTGISSSQATKLGHISVSQAVDLDTMESNIATNNSKTGITSGQASAITANTAKNGITSTEQEKLSHITVSSDIDLGTIASNVATNNSKTGITSSQASAISANSDKATNVSTNLGITGTTAARTITSSDGTNATIPVATTSVSGVMSASQVSTLNSRAPLADPALTGTPTAPTASANTNTTQIATTAYVQTEISDLINGAPGALQTLNDIADALGDDDDFASSVTTNLAAKAPIASPTFTGTVSGITKGMVGLGNVANIAVSGTNTGDEPDASVTVKGIVELATTDEALAGTDSDRAVTPAGLAARSYTETIGGSTTANVDHDLGTRNVMVQMYDSSSYDTIYADVVRTTANRVTITFNSAPSANDVTVLVTKID